MWVESKKVASCVYCGRLSKRHSLNHKTIVTETGKTELVVSKHYCPYCNKHFTNPDGEKHAPLRRNVSWGLILLALRLAENMTLENACDELRKQIGHELRPTTLHDWVMSKERLLKRYEEVAKDYLEKEV